MKKLKWFISGCTAMIAALFLSIPAMAGGYSARSELKVNIIGIRSWPEEPETVEELCLFTEQELPQATPSNASRSNASRVNIVHADDDLPNQSDNRLLDASLLNAGHTKLWEAENEGKQNAQENKGENGDFNRDNQADNLPEKALDDGQEERLSTPSDGKRVSQYP